MSKFVTVWYLVASIDSASYNESRAAAYTIPFATQAICLQEANRINASFRNSYKARCQFGQIPVAVLEKGDE